MQSFVEKEFENIFKKKYNLIICLKTKDEVELIEIWIKHHLNVVGNDGLIIIFDNQSKSSSVYEVYSKFAEDPRISIYDYFGNPDGLHHVNLNPNLYKSIINNSEYFCFLDTDEFLYCINFEKNTLESNILDFLESSNADWFPSIWLYNVSRQFGQFWIRSIDSLNDGLKWGKSVYKSISFDSSINGPIIHNVQYSKYAGSLKKKNGLICLHYTDLYPMQRIRSNYNKLVSIHGLNPSYLLEEIESWINNADLSKANSGSVYINEIINLLSLKEDIFINSDDVKFQSLFLSQEGNISFGSDQARSNFFSVFE